jgi:hypothetical protein
VEEAVDEDGGGDYEQAEGLVAAEGLLLGFAAGLLLALDFEADESVVHALPFLIAFLGSIAERQFWVSGFDFAWLVCSDRLWNSGLWVSLKWVGLGG